MHINQAGDYIILKLTEAFDEFNHLKLHKLLYYAQAWYLAFYGKKLFAEDFQAWIHGPINRTLYDRFVSTKSLYSDIERDDISPEFELNALSVQNRNHLDTILETDAKFSGVQLEEMTHKETPWIEARKGYRSSQRCEEPINAVVMREYYAARLKVNNDK
ncbi:MAG: hypothetical protein DRR16_23860 [Candidatus Parabeggiatoa sp. nov. 3]|nr:MAG: hypothetical protein DRR00_32855 [Gammaproteobacteria bacterium]RKZ63445.1 MAG: hypothetical protein DRQ99_17065 [Gammaproteobacteria bacterium]RKZ80439.1 MAG: hypothetical protein DRR16_23860 [Gammaproteobacteria bacterium]